MIIEDEIEIAKIRKKLNTFFDLDLYLNFLFLTSEESFSKHGHFGFSFKDYQSISFNIEPDILSEICNFLPENEYYVIPLLKENINFYKFEKSQILRFLEQNNLVDFVIFEKRMTWLLVYDRHRKLFGLGNYIKKKMKQNVNLRFGETKIEYVHTDQI